MFSAYTTPKTRMRSKHAGSHLSVVTFNVIAYAPAELDEAITENYKLTDDARMAHIVNAQRYGKTFIQTDCKLPGVEEIMEIDVPYHAVCAFHHAVMRYGQQKALDLSSNTGQTLFREAWQNSQYGQRFTQGNVVEWDSFDGKYNRDLFQTGENVHGGHPRDSFYGLIHHHIRSDQNPYIQGRPSLPSALAKVLA